MKEFHGSVKILMIERHENGFNRFVNSRNALQLILIDSFSFFLFFFEETFVIHFLILRILAFDFLQIFQ